MASPILRTWRVRPSWIVTRRTDVSPSVRRSAQQLDVRRAGAAALDDDAARQPIDVVRVGHAEHLRFVHALDLVPGMGQRGGEIAVVGQNQQPFRIEIEPADRVDVLAHAFQQIEHGRPLFRDRTAS